MKKELEERVYTLVELAEWFGITPGTMRNKKEKKLEELAAFAVFQDQGRKGILITEVIEPVYTKKGSISKQIIHQRIKETAAAVKNPSTYTEMGEYAVDNYTEVTVAKTTAARYSKDSIIATYGNPSDPHSNCRRVWATKDPATSQIDYLTEEEAAFLDQVIQLTYNQNEKNKEWARQQAFIDCRYKNGDLTKKEVDEELSEQRRRIYSPDTSWTSVMWKFKEKFNKWIINGIELGDELRIIEWE